MNLQKREIATRDLPDTPADELESEWRIAKGCFDRALAQKTEADRIYTTAAVRLNTIERRVKKEETRLAVERRAANRLLAKGINNSTAPGVGADGKSTWRTATHMVDGSSG